MLEELYLRRRLTSTQIARLVGMPERRIRERLREFGIPVRTRGQCNREDRTTLEGEALAEMYVGEQMSADKVAEALGVSRMVVLRNAHELGLPVRVSGPSRDGTTAPQIELVEALYAALRCAGRWSATASPRYHRAGRSGSGSLTPSR